MMSYKAQFLGFHVDTLTMAETLSLIDERIKNGLRTHHSSLNVAKIVTCQKDKLQASAIKNSDIVSADGKGLVWGMRYVGIDIAERVAGIDLFLNLLAYAQELKWPIFLLGATPAVLQKAIEKITGNFPGIVIAGSHHGYYGDREDHVVKSIVESKAQMLFVAMPSPQKEYFIENFYDKFDVKFVMGIGGSLDVISGDIKRAPLVLQRIGLEWFWRFMQEPRRLWKRYLITNLIFSALILKLKLKSIYAQRTS